MSNNCLQARVYKLYIVEGTVSLDMVHYVAMGKGKCERADTRGKIDQGHGALACGPQLLMSCYVTIVYIIE